MLVEAASRFQRHHADTLAAALAFHVLLGTAPLLLVVVAVTGSWLGEGQARAEIATLAADLGGHRFRELVQDWLDAARVWSTQATAVGLVLFLYGSSRAFSHLDAILDIIFEIDEVQHERFRSGTDAGTSIGEGTSLPAAPSTSTSWRAAIRSYAHSTAVAFGFSLLAGTLMAAAIVAHAAFAVWANDQQGWLAVLGGALQYIVPFVAMYVVLLVVYAVLPAKRLTFGDAALGAAITTFSLTVGLALLSLWLGQQDLGPYGAAGSVVAVLVWLMLSAQVVLYGAELTAVITDDRRARRREALRRKAPVRESAET